MHAHPLRGVVVPLLTPMDHLGGIDLEPVHEYLRALAVTGIPAVMPLGGNGEGPAVDRIAGAEFVAHVVSEWNALGGDRVLGGVIAPSTREALVRAEQLVQCGVDALVVSPPIYFRHTAREIAQHFAAFSAIGVPVVAYDNRKYSGNAINDEVVRQLVQMDHVVGVKDSSADFDNLRVNLDIARADRPEFGINVGDERAMLRGLRAGAVGVTPGTGNFAPALVQAVWEAFEAGDVERATAADDTAAALAGVHGIRPGIPTAKGILALRGIMPAHASLPFEPWTDDETLAMREFLAPFEQHLIGTWSG